MDLTHHMIIDDNFLNSKEKKMLDDLFLPNTTPFFIVDDSSAVGDNNDHFIHTLLSDGKASYLFNDLIPILDSFCKNNNISYKKIFRAALNITYNNGNDNCGIHTDHKFKHNQLLIYLNNQTGDTVVLNNQNQSIQKVTPKKYRGFYFDNKSHYHYYPIKGLRKVLVFTFL